MWDEKLVTDIVDRVWRGPGGDQDVVFRRSLASAAAGLVDPGLPREEFVSACAAMILKWVRGSGVRVYDPPRARRQRPPRRQKEHAESCGLRRSPDVTCSCGVMDDLPEI